MFTSNQSSLCHPGQHTSTSATPQRRCPIRLSPRRVFLLDSGLQKTLRPSDSSSFRPCPLAMKILCQLPIEQEPFFRQVSSRRHFLETTTRQVNRQIVDSFAQSISRYSSGRVTAFTNDLRDITEMNQEGQLLTLRQNVLNESRPHWPVRPREELVVRTATSDLECRAGPNWPGNT